MDLSRLSTDALASFAVFADHLNFTRAAEELHISQPALHVKVQKLAENLGRPLYTRQGRRLTLTSTGEQVARFRPRPRRPHDGFPRRRPRHRPRSRPDPGRR
ncbi:helix-turn-helix domain-containing protein [Spirillospora sp. CA-142024]|uniref:helix-turn-helix domain-containing protein n=1 Tax=Spirillospora sp. CA-142024 TaxID=3240036 RepID=UPI003D8D082A